MQYTIEQLKHLRNIRAIGLDDFFLDDGHSTERGFFEYETDRFFIWLEKMEKLGKTKDML